MRSRSQRDRIARRSCAAGMLLRKSLPIERKSLWRRIGMQFLRHLRVISVRQMALASVAAWLLFSRVGIAQTAQSAGSPTGSDILLHGSITPDKLGKHEMLAFDVPAGIERMSVELISPGFQKGMYLTAGMFDPQRYRGEGRSTFTLSTVDATGPYLPGPIVPGTWHIAVGYNWVAPDAKGEFTVKI